ncbi:MAG TPA: hypothetical protein VKV19_05220 [Ktedonobacteraceae bacterium]|nr:hypothetical protein [Ktedonobacteraceae bacterium]
MWRWLDARVTIRTLLSFPYQGLTCTRAPGQFRLRDGSSHQ